MISCLFKFFPKWCSLIPMETPSRRQCTSQRILLLTIMFVVVVVEEKFKMTLTENILSLSFSTFLVIVKPSFKNVLLYGSSLTRQLEMNEVKNWQVNTIISNIFHFYLCSSVSTVLDHQNIICTINLIIYSFFLPFNSHSIIHIHFSGKVLKK